jgi:hypothetical protein
MLVMIGAIRVDDNARSNLRCVPESSIGVLWLDLRDHQHIAIGVDEAHLFAWTRSAVLDLAGVDPVGEKLRV